MKNDNFATPMVLNFDRLTYAPPFTVILRKRFFFYFCPTYEWTNTLKLVGEKANTKSNQAEKEL